MVRMHHLRRDENKKVHTFNIVVVVHGIPSLQLHLSVGIFNPHLSIINHTTLHNIISPVGPVHCYKI